MGFNRKFILIFTLIMGTVGLPCELSIYSEISANPSEDSLIVSTIQNIPDLSVWSAPTNAPVALCSNGTWMVYPETNYTGEGMVLGLVSVPCLFSGSMIVKSAQTVGNTVENDIPSLNMFPVKDYNGLSFSIGGAWANIPFPFVSFILTGYYPDQLNTAITFFTDKDLQGNSTCIIKRSFVRDIMEFQIPHGSVKSFMYGCP